MISISPYILPGLPRRKMPKTLRSISPNDIIQAVCKYFGCEEYELKKRTRRQEFVYPRQIAIYLIRKLCKMYFSDIAAYFGKAIKDHSTVIHSVNVIKNYLYYPEINAAKKEDLEKIENMLPQYQIYE